MSRLGMPVKSGDRGPDAFPPGCLAFAPAKYSLDSYVFAKDSSAILPENAAGGAPFSARLSSHRNTLLRFRQALRTSPPGIQVL